MRGRRTAGKAIGALALGMACLAFVSPAGAETFRPNKTADHAVGACTNDDCTVREAISAANALSGKDAVVLRGGKTYNVTLNPANVEELNAAADLDVTDDVTIKASGKGYATLDAKRGNRVLDLATQSSADVTLRDLWIRNGFSSGDGAGVRAGAGGTVGLLMDHTKVTGSRINTNNSGGGVAVMNSMSGDSNAKITRSTISGNRTSDGSGGGLAAIDIGQITVESSTISGNRAGSPGEDGSGGGIYLINNATAMQMTNSTIANNKSTNNGGGLEVFAALASLESVTIAGNQADSDGAGGGVGGGLHLFPSATLEIGNTIIARNRSSSNISADCVSNAANVTATGPVFFRAEPQGCPELSGPVSVVQANPHLGRLASNGGPTQTVALQRGSKAIDRASAPAPGRDQRGRKRDSKPDIGAYER